MKKTLEGMDIADANGKFFVRDLRPGRPEGRGEATNELRQHRLPEIIYDKTR